VRIPSRHTQDNALESLSMTPMIDVVFLLLVFFVCAATGQIRELLLPTDLAAGAVSSSEPVEMETPLGEVWLRLRLKGGRTIVDLEGTDYEDFGRLQETLQALAATAPEIPVILDIQPDVPLGEVIRVYDACQASGFESVHFAADPQKAP
jgi:biopolymer transport protein ExbD